MILKTCIDYLLIFKFENLDKHQVIYAGCYSRKFDRHCFKDRVKQYGKINATYCYHTCDGFFCNPYESWLKGQSSFNLFESISIFG